MSHVAICKCLFCDNRPTIETSYMPVLGEKLMFGKYPQDAPVQIHYGICDLHIYKTRREVRMKLFELAEWGKVP